MYGEETTGTKPVYLWGKGRERKKNQGSLTFRRVLKASKDSRSGFGPNEAKEKRRKLLTAQSKQTWTKKRKGKAAFIF